jgi:hypothetical protein
MNQPEELINKIAQDKIDFNIGLDLLLKDEHYSFDKLFNTLRNYIINAIQIKKIIIQKLIKKP